MRIGLVLLAVLAALSACSNSFPEPIDRNILGASVEEISGLRIFVANQEPIGNGDVTFRFGDRCEADSTAHNRVDVIGISGQEILLRFTTAGGRDKSKNLCPSGVLFVVTKTDFDVLRHSRLFADTSELLNRSMIGTRVEFFGYGQGGVDNQTPVTNGSETFHYGERCEMNTHDFRHWADVIGVSGNSILLAYHTDNLSPVPQNRECIEGVLFVVSKAQYDEIVRRQRYVESERKRSAKPPMPEVSQ